jgi:hypothetical protein
VSLHLFHQLQHMLHHSNTCHALGSMLRLTIVIMACENRRTFTGITHSHNSDHFLLPGSEERPHLQPHLDICAMPYEPYISLRHVTPRAPVQLQVCMNVDCSLITMVLDRCLDYVCGGAVCNTRPSGRSTRRSPRDIFRNRDYGVFERNDGSP